ncbi:MAG: hypothetical protein ACKVT2_13815 [Saprospiraceae bacterium]
MKRIAIRFFLLLLSLILIGLVSCAKKDTVINGTITDAKTGMPIEGATIFYGVWDGGQATGTDEKKTGIDGKFTIVIAYSENFSGLTIKKGGYATKFGFGMPYKSGLVNNLDIKMYPRDATLRMVYENSSNIEKSIFLQAQSKTFNEEYGVLPYIITQPYPFVCQPNNKDTVDYFFTSDEQINLYWAFSYYEKASQSTFKDSLYLSRGDTATYSITF